MLTLKYMIFNKNDQLYIVRCAFKCMMWPFASNVLFISALICTWCGDWAGCGGCGDGLGAWPGLCGGPCCGDGGGCVCPLGLGLAAGDGPLGGHGLDGSEYCKHRNTILAITRIKRTERERERERDWEYLWHQIKAISVAWAYTTNIFEAL